MISRISLLFALVVLSFASVILADSSKQKSVTISAITTSSGSNVKAVGRSAYGYYRKYDGYYKNGHYYKPYYKSYYYKDQYNHRPYYHKNYNWGYKSRSYDYKPYKYDSSHYDHSGSYEYY
ncbi:unnamed protein product [Brachionus calyciflorus]|uniref:Uncharacterized protein n=1 Tax=Brachionus calyciflorus TaxID=104777 RepID=A0A813M174_9BILA|nr:unnamed protein product [Brachionus calyciflorus]